MARLFLIAINNTLKSLLRFWLALSARVGTMMWMLHHPMRVDVDLGSSLLAHLHYSCSAAGIPFFFFFPSFILTIAE